MIQQHPNGVVVTVRVTPRARRDSIDGEMRAGAGSENGGSVRTSGEVGAGLAGGEASARTGAGGAGSSQESGRKIGGGADYESALKVRLTAPPVDDRANDALRKLLARTLKVPVSAVKILSGEKSRTKRVLIEGVTVAQARELLGGAEG